MSVKAVAYQSNKKIVFFDQARVRANPSRKIPRADIPQLSSGCLRNKT